MKRDSKPANYRTLLTCENAKTSKGEKIGSGYRTGIMYLAPHFLSGVLNLCLFASPGCIFSCLNTAGRGGFTKIQLVRIAKTLFYAKCREAFLNSLRFDIRRLIRQAARLGMTPVVRVNGTSDIWKLAAQMAREFPQIQFYDYTKLPKPWQRILPNYHLTFSRSEKNESDCYDALNHGVNVAVVFDTKRKQPLPAQYLGRPVVDGDLHDLRFLDGYRGVIIGLRAKGKAKKDKFSGFVVSGTTLQPLTAEQS
jgi:hypothetical protein